VPFLDSARHTLIGGCLRLLFPLGVRAKPALSWAQDAFTAGDVGPLTGGYMVRNELTGAAMGKNGGRALRRLMAGTALGCSLFAAPAVAQVIDQTAAEDVVITTGAASSVRGQSTGGNVSITASQVQNDATTGIAVAGTADVGNVVIDVDAIATGGNGMEARTPGGGDITIDVGTVNAGGRGIFTRTLFLNPEEGFTSGDTIIRADSVTAGAGNAIVAQGYSVLVEANQLSGTANPNFTAATLYVSAGKGGADVDVGQTVSQGYGQWGIQVFSDGDTRVLSGSVATNGQFAQGINVGSTGHASITSGSIATAGDSAFGIVVEGYQAEPASIVIDSGTITTTGPNSTAIFTPGLGSGTIAITSDSISTAGENSFGITIGENPTLPYGPRAAAGGTGAVTIVSGKIETAAPTSLGIAVDHLGPISITSEEIRSGGAAIYVWANEQVDIDSGSIETTHGPGIVVYGGAGDVSVVSDDVQVGAAGDVGVFVRTVDGDIVIDSGTVVTTRPDLLGNITADGVTGWATGSGSVTITSDSSTVQGYLASAVVGLSAGGDVNITSGIAATSGDGAPAILASAGGKAVVVSNTVTATGADALGIYATGDAGVRVTAANVESTADAITALSMEGDVEVSTTGNVTSDLGHGVYAVARGKLDVRNSGEISGVSGIEGYAAGSSLSFVNSGTIVAIEAESEDGEEIEGGAVSLSTGFDPVAREFTVNAETASFENTLDGDIQGEITMGFAADKVTFVNRGTISTLEAGDSVIDMEVYSRNEIDGSAVNTTSVEFLNDVTGKITGAIGTNLSAASVTFTNRGSILSESAGEDGGQPALDIENMTAGSHSVSFTNAAGASVVSNGVGGIGVIVDSGAGLNAPEGDGGSTIGDDPDVQLAINVVNDGTIRANDGGDVYDVSEWGVPGVDTMVTLGGGIGIVGLAPQSAATLTNGAGGIIEATGDYSIAVYAEAGSFTLNNAGRITGGIGALIDSGMEDGGDLTVIHDLLEVGSTYIAGAIQTLDSVDTINNSGTITGSVDLNNRDDLLINSGTVRGTVDMGDGDDVVRLMTGSSVIGTFYGAEGTDSFELAGTSATLVTNQNVAASEGFEELNVTSGYWLANTTGTSSVFDTVTIAQGATLDVRETSINGVAASTIVTENVVTNGLLILHFNSDELADIDHLEISGTGGVMLTGEANFVADQNTLTFTGLSTIANGSLTLVGEGRLAGDVVTSGDGTFVLGDGGMTGTFEGNLVNNGRFIYNRSDSYDFIGDFSGTGSLIKRGEGTLTFTGDYSFTGTTVIEGGTVKFTGQVNPDTEIELDEGGTFDISGSPQTIAELSGVAGSTVVVEDSQLTVDQDTSTAFAGSITGDGSLVKTGSGTLNLTGNSTYTGPTLINEGALAVNGSIASIVTINDGGILKGTGTVGGAVVTSDGTLAPGNSIGTLNVAGDVTFAAGSVYEVEVNADGRSDQIIATGQALIEGGTVQVLAEAGTYRPFTEYVIIEAEGGVEGEFEEVTSNYAFLVPTLEYDEDAVRLQLVRNNVDFAEVAETANQASTGAAVESLGFESDLYSDVAILTEAGARQAFDALSGEAYASLSSGIVADSRHIADALLQAGREGGTGGWAQALGSWGGFDAASGVAGLDSDHQGLIGGVNYGMGGFGIGAAFGASKTDYDVRQRASSANVDSTFVGLQAGYGAGPINARIGGSYAWHDVDARRTVAFPGLSEAVEANYDAKTTQLFGEIGYQVPQGAMTFEPFARIEHVRVKTDGFEESGDTVALAVDRESRKVQFLSLGLRMTGSAPLSDTMTLEPKLSASWRRGWGDLTGRSTAAFDGSDDFAVLGARLPKNALDLDLGVGIRSGNFRIGASYKGTISNQWNSDGAQLTVGIAF
jgi:fibronectin-binding autotransporter adhesin